MAHHQREDVAFLLQPYCTPSHRKRLVKIRARMLIVSTRVLFLWFTPQNLLHVNNPELAERSRITLKPPQLMRMGTRKVRQLLHVQRDSHEARVYALLCSGTRC